jgi:hypothetical protein
MDGVDGEFRALERYPDHFAFDRIGGCSIAHREGQGSRKWDRADYSSRVHHRFVLGVRLFVFTDGMRALLNRPAAGNAGIRPQLIIEHRWSGAPEKV